MHTKSKRRVNKPQRLLDIITPVGYYGTTQNIITRKFDKRHHTIIAKRNTTPQDINRNSINRILQYGDKTIPSDLVLQLFMSQQFFDRGYFTWDRIKENWKDKLKSRPKSKASLEMKDFKNQCKRWLAKFAVKQWIYIKKSSIGLGLYSKKDVLRQDMKQVLREDTYRKYIGYNIWNVKGEVTLHYGQLYFDCARSSKEQSTNECQY